MTAPAMLPMPPRMITASPLSSTLRPMSGEMLLKASPKRTPAAPPSAEERRKLQVMTRSTSTPRIREARGFSATARICRPSRVRCSRKVSTSMSATETATMVSWSAEITAPPMRSGLSGKVPKGNRDTSGPQICRAMLSKMVAAASELISPEMFESARPRRGRKAMRSSTTPSIPAATMASGRASAMCRCASISASAMKAA